MGSTKLPCRLQKRYRSGVHFVENNSREVSDILAHTSAYIYFLLYLCYIGEHVNVLSSLIL